MSQVREIRSERGEQLQGLRAGFVSRAVASGTDVVLVLCVYVVAVIIVSIAWDLCFSKSISVAAPPHWLNELLVWILLVVYLTAGWSSTGRTLGKQMMGLRVVRSDGRPLRFLRALFRAAPLRNILPGASAGLGEPPKSRSRRRRLSDGGHLRLAPKKLQTPAGPSKDAQPMAQPMIEARPSAVPIVRS